jgi:hypothetical protein
MSHRLLRSACALLVALASLVAARVEADPIDGQLMKHGREIRDYCLKNRYDAVGILSFRMKNGDKPVSFRGGTIIQSLPERLEYALIMSLQQGSKEVKVAHNASAAATKVLGTANYRTTEERKKLFGVSYLQAWGKPRPQISVDAFLTGKVTIAPGLRTAKVEIESFDRRNPAVIRDVISFEVPVDRHILADSGTGFSLSAVTRGVFTRAVTDDDIIESTGAASADGPGIDGVDIDLDLSAAVSSATTLTADDSTSTTSGFPVEVTLYYSNVKQTLTPDVGITGISNYSVRTPSEGETLEIGLKNLTDEKLGVVLCVNGRSTLYEKKGQTDSLDRWALEPNSEYTIRGYFQDDNATYKPIKALSEEESERQYADLGGDESAGLIQVYVYRTTPKAPQVAGGTPGTDTSSAAKSDLEEIKNSASIRRFSEEELADSSTGTLSQLQELIVPGKLDYTRGLFAADWSDTRSEKLKTGTLGAVTLTDTMVIRYYSKKQ